MEVWSWQGSLNNKIFSFSEILIITREGVFILWQVNVAQLMQEHFCTKIQTSFLWGMFVQVSQTLFAIRIYLFQPEFPACWVDMCETVIIGLPGYQASVKSVTSLWKDEFDTAELWDLLQESLEKDKCSRFIFITVGHESSKSSFI